MRVNASHSLKIDRKRKTQKNCSFKLCPPILLYKGNSWKKNDKNICLLAKLLLKLDLKQVQNGATEVKRICVKIENIFFSANSINLF